MLALSAVGSLAAERLLGAFDGSRECGCWSLSCSGRPREDEMEARGDEIEARGGPVERKRVSESEGR